MASGSAGVDPDLLSGGVLFEGGSPIAVPSGEWLLEPVRRRPELIMAEIDLDAVDEAHADLDVAGHHSRPDVLALRVDTSRRSSVHTPAEIPPEGGRSRDGASEPLAAHTQL